MLHLFRETIEEIPIPERLNNPFHYTPHPLCLLAADEVRQYLAQRTEWKEELDAGKMFGVLVVRTPDGRIGYLAAFSGNLAGTNRHPYFVPPVYDMLQPGDFFRRGETEISAINRRIETQEQDARYRELRNEISREEECSSREIAAAKARMQEARTSRAMQRQTAPDETVLAALTRESQHEKAELRRLKQRWNERLEALRLEAGVHTRKIEALRSERRTRSAALQAELFRHFRLLNARGESRSLGDIFSTTTRGIPPAGAGECAAPKLLQYAFLHDLRPLALAEFWRGNSPRGEIRLDGHYYPACRGKCGPILHHMLRGLDVEPEPLRENPQTEPTILYEDDRIVAVCKPAGMLSVPGKSEATSVLSWAEERYPEATGPLLVHRLDMDTSGILLLAKTKQAHQNLQAQFKHRTVRKRYIALLDGTISTPSGRIELPLRADVDDRPRQRVDPLHGKPAVTEYETIDVHEGRTRIVFRPLTGRTHQLRIHAAHPAGLNVPIVGDPLYGTPAQRLFLHAERLEFLHPATGLPIRIDCPSDF